MYTKTDKDMEQLIQIVEQDGQSVVSARELHEFLESKREFSTWIKDRIKKYGFVDGQDYTSFDEIVKRENGATTRIEYALTLDCAKEIAMVEGNAKGKQARQYFIEVEKRAKAIVKPMTQAEQLLANAKVLVEQERRINAVEDKVALLEAKTTTKPDYFTVAGYGSLHGIHVNIKIASIIGRKAASLCKSRGIPTDKIPDPRFGTVRMYPTHVLKEVFDSTDIV